MQQDLSIYVHYPFCKSKCPYCDFNSHVRENVDFAAFLAAYESELDFFAKKIGNRKVKTIFFGGGTPSLMPLQLVEGILKKISQVFSLAENCEITLEANPTSFEGAKFKGFRDLGINRLSLGIQALNDDDLKFLGRTHSAKEAISVIENAAKIFENFSFDLIYARPKQTLDSWARELEQAMNFGTKHLSLYQLTIEKGTKFFAQFQRQEFTMPSEELSAEFYELTEKIARQNGFNSYEISNYAKKNHECKHNLVYWQGGDYIGIGAGAHSRIGGLTPFNSRQAIMMIHEPLNWLKEVQKSGAGIQNIDDINSEELLQELVLMGLRLQEGISNKIFLKFFNKNITEIFNLEKLQNLVEFDGEFLRIADDKRIVANAVIEKVLFKRWG